MDRPANDNYIVGFDLAFGPDQTIVTRGPPKPPRLSAADDFLKRIRGKSWREMKRWLAASSGSGRVDDGHS